MRHTYGKTHNTPYLLVASRCGILVVAAVGMRYSQDHPPRRDHRPCFSPSRLVVDCKRPMRHSSRVCRVVHLCATQHTNSNWSSCLFSSPSSFSTAHGLQSGRFISSSPFLSLHMKRTYTSCGCELQNMCAPASLFTANHASELDVVVCLCRTFSSHLIGALSVVCSYFHSRLLAVLIQGGRDHKKLWSYRYSACTRAPGKEAGLGWVWFQSLVFNFRRHQFNRGRST
ncbi:hypothetical protein QR685DRAFT_366308 [Neurospora intermedia]|uniref:Uncharacterized protein n=1 Tax=Neurospora intermedia TaxID=5142 RepID=A0ABR3D5U5_NEUIN